MGKKIQLSNKDYGILIAGIMSNKSQKIMAKLLGISVDTVSRILKENPHHNLGESSFLSKDDEKHITITDTSAIIVTNGFTFENIVETGDASDGILIQLAYDDYDNYDTTTTTVKNSAVVGKLISLDTDQYTLSYGVEDELLHRLDSDSISKGFGIVSISPSDHLYTDLMEGQSFYIQQPEIEEPVGEQTEEPVAVDEEAEEVEENPQDVQWSANSKYISINRGIDVYSADNTHSQFKRIVELLIEEKYDDAIGIISLKEGIKTYSKNGIVIENNKLYWDRIEIRSGLVNRIINDFYEGKDFKKYIPFLENLLLNPSYRAVNRLYDFLNANDIKITDDGHFLAFKIIKSNYTDCYTGKIDNSVGTLVKVPRNQVDEDDRNTCSHGLHVCSRGYIGYYGGSESILVEVKVNPKDVVAIPMDYNDAKMRVCEYLVTRDL